MFAYFLMFFFIFKFLNMIFYYKYRHVNIKIRRETSDEYVEKN